MIPVITITMPPKVKSSNWASSCNKVATHAPPTPMTKPATIAGQFFSNIPEIVSVNPNIKTMSSVMRMGIGVTNIDNRQIDVTNTPYESHNQPIILLIMF